MPPPTLLQLSVILISGVFFVNRYYRCEFQLAVITEKSHAVEGATSHVEDTERLNICFNTKVIILMLSLDLLILLQKYHLIYFIITSC